MSTAMVALANGTMGVLVGYLLAGGFRRRIAQCSICRQGAGNDCPHFEAK